MFSHLFPFSYQQNNHVIDRVTWGTWGTNPYTKYSHFKDLNKA